MPPDYPFDLIWQTRLHTVRPLSSWPAMHLIAREHQSSSRYLFNGKSRANQLELSFQYTLRGHGKVAYRGEHYDVLPGQGFLFRLNDPELTYYFPQDGREAWQFIYAVFTGEGLAAMTDALLHRWGPVHALPMHQGIIQQWLSYEAQGVDERRISARESAALVNGLFESILSARESMDLHPHEHFLVHEAQDVVSQKLQDGLNASDLAQAVGVSREHLSRLFRSELGTSPYQYIVRERLDRATYLLKTTTLSCKEISGRCGFEAPSQFNKAFKQEYNLTPRGYRQIRGR